MPIKIARYIRIDGTEETKTAYGHRYVDVNKFNIQFTKDNSILINKIDNFFYI